MTFSKPQIIMYCLILVGVIGVVILLVTLFKGNKNTNQDLVKQLIAAKDSVIAAKQENIVAAERLIEEKSRTYEMLQQRDSVLNAHYAETEKLYKDINAKIKNIPERIAKLATNNDSLRSLLSTY